MTKQHYALKGDTLATIEIPQVVGYWIFPGSAHGHMTRLPASGKPSWLHRFAMWMVFGFKWEDKHESNAELTGNRRRAAQ